MYVAVKLECAGQGLVQPRGLPVRLHQHRLQCVVFRPGTDGLAYDSVLGTSVPRRRDSLHLGSVAKCALNRYKQQTLHRIETLGRVCKHPILAAL